MTAILIESRQPGSSSWVNVRGPKKTVQIKGMKDGDLVEVYAFNGEMHALATHEDCKMELPDSTKRVRAVHVASSGNPVSVDMRNGT